MKTAIGAAILALFLPAAALAESQGSPSAPGAKVFIIEPKDGAAVTSPVLVKFGIEGMEIASAGSDTPNSGHHHLIIDGKVDDMTAAIPADDNHKHFGKGQTEATIDLKPGEHTLQLVLGDKNHVPHNPPVESDVVKITVK
jgi:hypothetical protein